MAVIMYIACSRTVMGDFTISRGLRVFGWLATGVMGLAAAGMIVTF
jgi:Mn2+/Fe2+ NRAMP family transporter